MKFVLLEPDAWKFGQQLLWILMFEHCNIYVNILLRFGFSSEKDESTNPLLVNSDICRVKLKWILFSKFRLKPWNLVRLRWYLLNSRLRGVDLYLASQKMTSLRKTYAILFPILVLVVNQKSRLFLKNRKMITIK